METYIELVNKHGRAIAHMRQLVSKRRLGLALGAGVSQSAGFPSWKELLERVTEKLVVKGIDGRELHKESEPMRAQILLARFRTYAASSPDIIESDASHRDAAIATQWRELLRESLYRNVENPDELVDRHPYLSDLATLAFKVPVVVTYNFDDLLERALAQANQRPEDTVGYYSAWGPRFVVQDGRPVIYHPNGYVPYKPIDRYSEHVVLTEESLSDQIIDSMMGAYGLLLDYYSRSSCLFVGSALSDPSLRSMLRQAARRAPGTVHYYIRFCKSNPPELTEIDETRRANFDLFNMITLYLNQEEITALLRLIAGVDEDTFVDAFERAGVPLTYRYYVAGPVSVGKTSAISRVQGVEIVDEWLKPRDPLIAKPSNELTSEERKRVDTWIYDQLRLKNRRFSKAGTGLHIMDRAPLDAFAFTPPAEYAAKAEDLYNIACNANSGTPKEFKSGKLIVLTGRPYDLLTRQKWRGRGGKEEYIADQQSRLIEVYEAVHCGPMTKIETSGLDLDAVAKEVSRHIHLEPYEEFHFARRLRDYLPARP